MCRVSVIRQSLIEDVVLDPRPHSGWELCGCGQDAVGMVMELAPPATCQTYTFVMFVPNEDT